ncbi:cache domain-containing protein [Nocardia testacea]|uniref:cache domain-containing protein n=1 Tax=Nocardia testacea TaxID=248551 RepID=UPI0002FF2C22|nr:cache domain-containing protein [Nocardia testacea]
MTDNPRPPTVESLASVVAELAEQIYSSLATIGAALTGVWEEATGRRRAAPRSTDLAALREPIVDELEQVGDLFDGAGVVIADGVLADRPRFLEWWQMHPEHRPHRLDPELNPQSEYFYDYTQMDWYVVPRDERHRWVHGPYIDFACTDQYVCTFAVPVTAGGQFLGIAGADVPVGAMQEILLPRFRTSVSPLVLVNDEGRVILATDPGLPPGSKTRGAGRIGGGVPIDTLPWSLCRLEDTAPH